MTRVCEQCGQAITKRNNKRFCSGSCRTQWVNEHVGNPAKRPEARAKISAARRGKPTTFGPLSESQRRNISRALKGRTIPDEQRRKTSATAKRLGIRPPVLRGADNGNWRGGRPSRSGEYKNPAYIAFRNGVFARDGYRCVDCGWTPSTTSVRRRGSKDKLHAHHVKTWAKFPDLRYEIANGVTLCHGCHAARHRGTAAVPVRVARA